MGFFSKSKEREVARTQEIKDKIIEYYRKTYDDATANIIIPQNPLKAGNIFCFKDCENLYLLYDINIKIKKIESKDYLQEADFNFYKEICDGDWWIRKITIKNIKWFKKTGSIGRETIITGGGGSGTSVGGAIVGGLVGGSAGAIIGSRKKVEPIKSKTISYDTRGVSLVWTYIKDQKEKETFVSMDSSAYEIFMELIPEKEYNYVMSQKLPKEQPASTKSTKDKLLELKEMLDSGLITQDEFDNKKAELLKEM